MKIQLVRDSLNRCTVVDWPGSEDDCWDFGAGTLAVGQRVKLMHRGCVPHVGTVIDRGEWIEPKTGTRYDRYTVELVGVA